MMTWFAQRQVPPISIIISDALTDSTGKSGLQAGRNHRTGRND
jgi:hypothetical protein